MKRNFYTAGLFLLSLFFLPQEKKITIFMAGDSTMSNKEVKTYPETGWGMPFAYFFDSTVAIDNRAKNGRSTGTFISEGLWQKLIDDVKPGDYVFIQFGHNDEVPTKKSYVTEKEFKANLLKFINETKNKKANPVLITPVARRKFDSTGHIEETHAVYAQIVRDVARENNIPLIDLDATSQALLQELGPESSKFLFDYLKPGEHPNYPDGKQDDTHFSELGARKMAQLVLAGIKELHLDLANHIRPPLEVKK